MTTQLLRRLTALALATLALAGCGDDGEDREAPRAEATATATATPEPAPEAPPLPRAENVRFRAADGKRVRAQYAAAAERGAPGVVLLHEIRGGPDQWDPLVAFLHDAGYATLAYKSRASAFEHDRLPDAIGAVRWLRDQPGVDRERMALVGASIGASTTVLAMATDARRLVDAAVALSPPDSGDIWALQDDDRYEPRNILFVSDEREATSAEGMMDGAVDSEHIQSEGPGHGIALLGEAGVLDALLAWLDDHAE